MLESAVAEAMTASPSEPAPDDLLTMLDLLPCMAFLASDRRIIGQNQLAATITGLTAEQPIHFERVFLGEFPNAVTEASGTEAAAFDCLLLRQNTLPLPIHGAIRTVAPGVRLIVALEQVLVPGAGEGSIFGDLLDSAPEAMAITHDGQLLHVNREFSRLFGYEPEVCIGRDLDALLLPDGRQHENEILYHMVATEGRAAIETVRNTREKLAVAVSVVVAPVCLSGSTMGLFHTFRDIRRQKEQEARLQYSAMHDALTGLPNRSLFLDRLRLTLARLQRRPDRQFAVMFLDIDSFKNVNDTLGHDGGDALLLEVTRRLLESVRPQDTVARYGGDEFAVLIDEAATCDDIAHVAERIQATVREAAMVEGRSVTVSLSIGIAVVTPEYQRAEEVVRAADLAMYMAKANGKAQHAFAPAPSCDGATMQPCPASARRPQPPA